MIQLVNVVGIVVLSIMIAESDSMKSTAAKACSLNDTAAAQMACEKAVSLRKPCNEGKGWVIAALVINVLVLLLVAPAMTASVKKYGKALRGFKVRVTTDDDNYGSSEEPMGEDMGEEAPMRGGDEFSPE